MNQKEVITEFYKAFQQLDAEKMVSFYHEEVVFEDPGFGRLEGERAKNMWRMLCNNAKEFTLEFSEITDNSAHWEPKYTFSQSGRRVHNIIDASFEFQDGKIIKHTDVFNLHHWSKQAIGVKGWLLGGTSFFRKKLQQQTGKLLDKYEARK